VHLLVIHKHFTGLCVKLKNKASSFKQTVMNNYEEVEIGLREHQFVIWAPNGR
jgi:hypothetical protein